MVIKDYHAKLDAAKWVEREIYSTPVYISKYKMGLEVYPNGLGEAKSSHMSVFFSIMRGEWDPIIKWPFDKDVKICLINQEKGKDSICHTIEPYRTNRGAISAYGFPKFASHQIIDGGGFAKDDTVFLRCEIGI